MDTASTSTAAPLTRAASGYCDSSCCLFCQGPEPDRAPEAPASTLGARPSASTVLLRQQVAQTLRAGGIQRAAAACSAGSVQAGGSQASSQTSQGSMVLAGNHTPEQEAEVIRENGREHAAASREGSTTPRSDERADFVTVERAALRHSYASSTNLSQQLAAEPHKRQRLSGAAALEDDAGDSSAGWEQLPPAVSR